MEAGSDPELIAAILGGDLDAFGALVHRYRDRHTRFAVRMLGNSDDADEVMQSVFMRVFRNLRSCNDPARFGAWLHRITVNECRTFATRSGARERRLIRGEAIEHLPGADDEGAAPLDLAEVHRALGRLVPEQREAFLLKHIEDLSYDEIADLTGAGVSALKMRVKRACEHLREILEDARHDP